MSSRDAAAGARRRFGDRVTAVAGSLDRRRAALEESRRIGVLLGTWRRFDAIDGSEYSARITLFLLVGVVPLLIILFAWATSFQPTSSFANLLSRTYRLDDVTRGLVDETFSTSEAVRVVASVVGAASFLFVGNSLATSFARVFAAAWQVPFRKGAGQTVRGIAWFVLLLATQIANEIIWDASGADRGGFDWRIAVLPAFVLTGFIFWWVTPRLLLGGDLGWRPLLPTALAGLVVGNVIRAAGQIILPNWMLYYGQAFGGFGVVVGLAFWYWMVAYGWVLIAAFGAVYWERLVPIDRILAVQDAARAADTDAADTDAAGAVEADPLTSDAAAAGEIDPVRPASTDAPPHASAGPEDGSGTSQD